MSHDYCKIKQPEINSQIREFFLAFHEGHIGIEVLVAGLLDIEAPLREEFRVSGIHNAGLWFKWSSADQSSTTIWDIERAFTGYGIEFKKKMKENIAVGLNSVIISFIS